MPRTIKSTGNYALDREIDALWDASQGRSGDFERIVQPVIIQTVTNNPEFITILEEKIENFIWNVVGVRSLRVEGNTTTSGDISFIPGTAIYITQANTTFRFDVATCDERGEPITAPIPPTSYFYDQFTETDPTNLAVHTPNIGTGWRSIVDATYNPHSAYPDGYCRAFAIGKPWQDWIIDWVEHQKELNISCDVGWTTTPSKTMRLLWSEYVTPEPNPPSDTYTVEIRYLSATGEMEVSCPQLSVTATKTYTIGNFVNVRLKIRKFSTSLYIDNNLVETVIREEPQLVKGWAGIRTTGGGISLDAAYDNFTITGPFDPMAGLSDIPAKCDHMHEGVHAIKVDGGPDMMGDVNFVPGENVSLSQSGNDITVRAHTSWRRHLLLG